MVIKNEDGHLILMALIVLLVLCIIGTALISTAGLENKMASNDKETKQAILAADAGIELAREMIIGKLNNQVPIDIIKNDLQNYAITMGNSVATVIKDVDISNYNNEGKIKLTSVGSYQNAVKKVMVTLQFDNLPGNPIKANQLKVAGRYNEYIDNDNTWFNDDEEDPGWLIRTYFQPWGKVLVNGGDIGCNSIINAEINSDFFNTSLAQTAIDNMSPKSSLISPNPDRPAHIFNTEDFLTATRQNNIIPPVFTKNDVAAFYRLAVTDAENWMIWEPGTLDFTKITKPFNYVKSNLDNSKGAVTSTNKVGVAVKSNFGIIMGDYFKLVFKIDKPKLPAGNGEANVILIVSNDNIEFTIDGNAAAVSGKGIDLSGVTFYLLSSNSISFINYCTAAGGDIFNTKYKYNVYALAGKDIELNSSIENVIINGSLQANQNVIIDISDRANDPNNVLNHANQALVTINGADNKSLMDNFPLHWALLGVGKIMEYVGE